MASGRAQSQEADQGSVSGLDITRPLRRIELRTEVADEEDGRTATFTLRHDRPQVIATDWRLNLRVEIPLVIDKSRAEGSRAGLGDVRMQAVVVHDGGTGKAWGVGLQVRAPTGDTPLGRGQWQILPMAGYRWSLDELPEGSFLQFVARYRASFGGGRDRTNVSELQLSPNLEIGLPHDMYLSIFPSNDIRYDFRRDGLFVPVDVEVGKEWGRTILSVEAATKVISTHDVAPYDWKIEVRLGYRF
ncbi:transporter [Novosphingobium soli]|uniref:Transporter n=1 Tax=Novosphingobium soli TaxID=574956 RepID=A0ABV6CQ61_9SPHN